MSIYDKIDKMTKEQAHVVAKYAQARVDALDKEKKDAIKALEVAFHERAPIRFYGQDCYVVCAAVNFDGWNPVPSHEFELDNGSKIVIRLD